MVRVNRLWRPCFKNVTHKIKFEYLRCSGGNIYKMMVMVTEFSDMQGFQAPWSEKRPMAMKAKELFSVCWRIVSLAWAGVTAFAPKQLFIG